MAGLKALAKETAIYGMSSIIGRFLNTDIYQRFACGIGGLWYHYQYVCYNCLADGAFNIWYGNRIFPVCQ